jgi:hypothetical protein
MPLTKKGKKILRAMRKRYGPERGKRVFYASENKGTISGIHAQGQNPRSHRKDDRPAYMRLVDRATRQRRKR